MTSGLVDEDDKNPGFNPDNDGSSDDIAEIKNQLEGCKSKAKIIESVSEERAKKITEISKEISEKNVAIDTLTKEQEKLNNIITEKDKKISSLKVELDSKENALNDCQKNLENDVAERNKELNEKISKLQDEKTKLENKIIDIEDQQKFGDKETQVKYEKLLKQLRDEIERLKKEPKEGECISGSYDELCEAANKKNIELANQIASLLARINFLENNK